ncbi:hypothetical protein Dda_3562 [Drechslerella dactyloides]|uniref:Uncharacterized protein n=1 Tax=Drechslerella dactyloides TaxID=74499 RepID=A0AAD6IYM9_DREDA|nr:hypothetical protein Dda_3562 [Drechslerella dactyloides]
MTDEATKPPATRSRKTSIHAILSDGAGNTFAAQHPHLLKIGEPAADRTTSSPFQPAAVESSIPGLLARRIPDHERQRQRRASFLPAQSELPPGPERDIQDSSKRRKLSLFPQSPFSCVSTELEHQAQRDDPFSLSVGDDAPLRTFPVREYPRRLSIASVLTADSSSLPSVVSPATTTSWAGLASASSSTTTTNPPQWPLLSELYHPLSRRSPIPSVASASIALGTHSRKDQSFSDDTDLRIWELDFEAASSRIKTPLLRKVPRHSLPRVDPSRTDQSVTMADPVEGLPEAVLHPGGPLAHRTDDSELQDPTASLPTEDIKPGTQSHSLQAYNDLVTDLQHKLSTKTLALETLQKEHERLLGAYSRQQTRSAAIQKKCTVADAEIVSLSAERDRLQEALEQSETQVQDLTEQRDSINRRLVSRVREYSGIIQLASQMERLSMVELNKWKERESVLRSRIIERDQVIEDIRQRLAFSESSEEARRSSSSPGGDADANEVAVLRRENQVLKERVQELETTVHESKQEVSRMEEIGRMLLHRSREGSDPASQPTNPPT